MKRKIVFLALLSITMLSSFAKSSTGLKYRYTRYGAGYSSATYRGTNRTYNRYAEFRKMYDIMVNAPDTTVALCYASDLDGLNNALLWDALREFNYHIGEVYEFTILPNGLTNSPCLQVWAEVESVDGIVFEGFFFWVD